jgi:hypothetical protein
MPPKFDIPEGYKIKHRYQRKPYTKLVIQLFLLASLTEIIAPEAANLTINYFLDEISQTQFLWTILQYLPYIMISLVATIIPHELIHRVVIQLLGYEAEIHWRFFQIPPQDPFVMPLDEYVKRDHLFIGLLSPLFVIGFFAGILSYVDFLWQITLIGKSILILNTAISSFDIYDSLYYSRLLEDSLLYYSAEDEEPNPYILIPESQ